MPADPHKRTSRKVSTDEDIELRRARGEVHSYFLRFGYMLIPLRLVVQNVVGQANRIS